MLTFAFLPGFELFLSPADILDNVVVLNSTAVMLQWSTMPSTSLVHCCPDRMECLVGNADTSLNSFVFSGLEEYTNYTVSIVGESQEVYITTYQDSKSLVCAL